MILPGFKQMMTKLTTNSNVVSETQPNLVTRKLRQPDLKPLPRCIKHCYSDDAVHVVIAFLRPKLLQGGARPFPCIISKSIRRLRAFSRVTCVTKWTKRSKCRISGRMTFQLQNGPCAAPAGINANGRDGFAWRWTKTVSREGNYNRENALKNDHSGFVRLGYIATKWDRYWRFHLIQCWYGSAPTTAFFSVGHPPVPPCAVRISYLYVSMGSEDNISSTYDDASHLPWLAGSNLLLTSQQVFPTANHFCARACGC